ncbi:MAG: hypothetical protein HYS13_00575 [Planctomycetia bacterium]|nr:hypothetical protein [Planctomycetia bacterium]
MRWSLPILVSLCSALLLAAPAAAQGRVEMEIATEGNAGLEAQTWSRILTQLKVDGLTIRTARAGDAVKIETTGGERPVYKVKGRLTATNELVLPGGKFTTRDTAPLARWLEKLRTEGPPGSARPKLPFGLTETELERVQSDFKARVDLATKGMDRADALDKIAAKLKSKLSQAADVPAALAEAGPVAEDLSGLSAGTALACILRPAGLGIAPRGNGKGEVRYEVRPLKAETWPVGLVVEENERELVPALFEKLNAEIKEGTPLSKALAAIGPKVGIPMLYDHNALALADVDPDKTLVSLKPAKYLLIMVVEKTVRQARLNPQLRTDEAGKPFYWITAGR